MLDFFQHEVVVGGPGIDLMPGYFDDIERVRHESYFPGVLQIVNPIATKTTSGCVRNCSFCAVPRLEGKIKELSFWPNLPIICDNNLLGSSVKHFDVVVGGLIKLGWADFNQGIDARLLTEYHAARIAEIKKPVIRLALDSMAYKDSWLEAYEKLRGAGIAKQWIKSLILIANEDDETNSVDEAWERCTFIDKMNIDASPMWFHRLDALAKNVITEGQKRLGWTDYERRRIMQWFYKHKRAVI